MHSPLHHDARLFPIDLERGLRAYQCPKSKGCWIPLQSYLTWHELHVGRTQPLPIGYQPQLANDSARPTLICPESGCLLVRYRVGQGLSFQIDRSPRTGGVWLDAGEWEALKARNLHEQLHLIFTAPYQKRIRSQSFNEMLEERFQNRIGESDFARVKDFKSWLQAHPSHRDIVAYLLDGDEE